MCIMPTTPRRSRTLRADSPAAARQGRANFDAYFQLATFSPRTFSWGAGKGAYWTEEEARGAAKPGVEYRLLRVAPEGRTIVDTFTV